MTKSKEFFDLALDYIKQLEVTRKPEIIKAASLMGDCMMENGLVQLFGINHGIAFSMELGYRAGGLMPFHQFRVTDLLFRGVISEEEFSDPNFNNNTDMAHKMLEMYNIDPKDMFILISLAGNEAILVETALTVKEKGHKVIAILSEKKAKNSPIIHESGKKLTDVVDLVMDITSPYPDTVVTLSNGTQFNQVSTICGNVIAQMLTAETYRYLKEKGQDCPVLLSANVKGADVHNRAISDKYLGRWNS